MKLDAPAHYAIVRAVARGLRELKEVAHRGCGVLGACNVLIRGQTLARADVVLCDPSGEFRPRIEGEGRDEGQGAGRRAPRPRGRWRPPRRPTWRRWGG